MEIHKNFYDVIIVGGGPAGLSAAIYMARAKYKVLVLEKAGFGGQITITSEIVNYPGIVKASGKELTEAMRRQAEAFGAEFAIAEVVDMELNQQVKQLHTTKGRYEALGVILATGANPRKLGFKGEREFQGRGVAYCATCDGEFFQGLKVFVIGGGFAAVEEGIFLTRYAKDVTLIVREEDFTCAKTVSDQLKNYDNIEVHFETQIIEVGGRDMVTYARFRDDRTQEEWTYDAGSGGGIGVFVFAGYVPNTEWIGTEIKKDKHGYLLTDENQKTNLEGVYGAGDVCVKNLRQVVTAVSDGAAAATSLEKDLAKLHEALEIPELVREKRPGENKKAEESRREPNSSEKNDPEEGFLTGPIRQQLETVFAKFQNPVILKAWLDESPLSGEMLGFLREIEGMTDKITWKEQDTEAVPEGLMIPSIELCYEDGTSSGIHFHGVPGGHEFNSFVIALYNVAGPGQDADWEAKEFFENQKEKINFKVLVSLSCTMCPETVMAAQKAASLSGRIEAEMFDLAHFPQLKQKYKVMSVPCIIVNDEKVFFGKKGLKELMELVLG